MKLTVRNPKFEQKSVWFFDQPEFFEYEGDEVKVKWCQPDEIAISTGNPEFAFRIVKRDRIVKIDGKAQKPTVSLVETKIVKGSKGDEYIVTKGPGGMSCTCSGFQFRKTCKHVTNF
jgi:hypothetical protein